MHPTLPAALLPLFAVPLWAQTFVVDAAMGPGANFPDIATAVVAVPDGATIEVRAGSYGNFTIDHKSLVISGLPGAQVMAQILDVKVRNLAANQAVTLRNLAFGSWGAPGELRCEVNSGRILVQSCSLALVTPFTAPSITALFTTNLHVVDTSLVGSTVWPLGLQFSRAFVSGCVLTPVSNFSIGGILLNSSWCDVADTPITTLGIATMSSPITMTGAGSTAIVRAGCRLQTTSPNAQTLVEGNGALVLDPTVQLIGAQAFGSGVNVAMLAMPRVTAIPAVIGTPATATLTLPSGSVGGLWFGFAQPPFLAPVFATPLQLDANIALSVRAGTATTQTAALPLPNLPGLRGLDFAWQGCSFHPVDGWQASNAVVFTAW